MKKLLNFLLAAGVFVSCRKEDLKISSDANSLPAAYVRYSPINQSLISENIDVAADNKLTQIYFSTVDTSGNEVYLDSGSYHFDYTNANSLPSGYTYQSTYAIPQRMNAGSSVTEYHLLYYDNGNRVIKDSGLNNVPTSYFTYSDDFVIYSNYLHNGNDYSQYYLDTLFVNGDHNLTARNSYYTPGQGNQHIVPFTTDANFRNPLYDNTLSYSLGAFLLTRELGDFISQRLTTEYTGYTWSSDSQGRPLYTDGGGSETIKYVYR